jgi:fructan beta-fructosidase
MNSLLFSFAPVMVCAVIGTLRAEPPDQAPASPAVPVPILRTNATRDFLVAKPYLILPVKNGAPKRLATLTVNGQFVDQFEIELPDLKADWWAFVDLAQYRGKTASLTVDRLPVNSSALDLIEQAESIQGPEPLYRERLRPQFHFSSRRGWNNDPNGLVYSAGEYHLFYQHNPFGWSWGNMHWGHAISRDLLHWRELPTALYPDELGTMFSGSAVVDEGNTAGFQRGDDRPIVCVYTAAGGTSQRSKGQPFTQCLAYSNDRGRSWAKFAENPVLAHVAGENRDPKVIWYAPENKWVMALYLDRNDYALFASKDLKHWERMSDVTIPGTSECPEFFEIALDGQPEEKRWVFYGGNGRYLIGRFDGRKFTPESGPHELNYGNCFYASQTYNNLPPKAGRRILIPWGTVAIPGMPFNQMMGLPIELALKKGKEGFRLYAQPINEIKVLRSQKQVIKSQTLKPGENPLAQINGELLDLELEIAPDQAQELQFNIRGIPVVYHVGKLELTCQTKKGPLPMIEGRIRLRFLVDRASVEIFGNEGALYMPMAVIPDPANRSLEISAKSGSAKLNSVAVYELQSVW